MSGVRGGEGKGSVTKAPDVFGKCNNVYFKSILPRTFQISQEKLQIITTLHKYFIESNLNYESFLSSQKKKLLDKDKEISTIMNILNSMNLQDSDVVVAFKKVKKITKKITNEVKTEEYSCNVKKCDFITEGKQGLNSNIQLNQFIYQNLLMKKNREIT